MACEEERTRLIGQIVSLLREGSVPEDAHNAGLTFISWLARRMPGEPVSLAGVEEMLRRCKESGYGAADPESAVGQGPRTANTSAEPMNDTDNPRTASATRGSSRRRR